MEISNRQKNRTQKSRKPRPPKRMSSYDDYKVKQWRRGIEAHKAAMKADAAAEPKAKVVRIDLEEAAETAKRIGTVKARAEYAALKRKYNQKGTN